MAILAKAGVKPEMTFRCCVCSDTITGQQVIDGDYLYIVKADRENLAASVFRCECCQDEWEERHHD